MLSIYFCSRTRKLLGSVKFLCLLGFLFGVSDAVVVVMIAYPPFFDIVYLVPIVWFAVTLNGVEHWLFAL